jgi:hypothetical protein
MGQLPSFTLGRRTGSSARKSCAYQSPYANCFGNFGGIENREAAARALENQSNAGAKPFLRPKYDKIVW